MALTNTSARGNYTNHRLDGAAIHGDLLLTGDQGVSSLLGVDATNTLTVNGGQVYGSPAADLIDGNSAGNTVRTTLPGRFTSMSNGTALTSGVMYHTAVVLYAGDVINYIAYRAAGGATTPTHLWFALYDNQATPALLAQTADQGSLAVSNNTTLQLQLQSTVNITQTGVYYTAVMSAAATPILLAITNMTTAANSSGYCASQKRIQGSSGSGLTTTAPPTIASPTATSEHHYAVLSQAV